tara:strand:+ start:1587 stop:2297 length:711 start_codon:yes stop_codon:yes gene_type:complete
MNIRALLLSAGFGTRLRPLTNNTPKCLVKVNNIPILEHWLQKLESVGVHEILINTHYLANKVNAYLSSRMKTNIVIKTVYESELKGTAGTLIWNKDFFKNGEIMLIHADNFTKSNLKGMFDTYSKKTNEIKLTMLTFKTDNPKNCGIVSLDKSGIVTDFYEKIENPPSNIANGAIYLFNYQLIEWIEKNAPMAKDFSCDVLPLLMNKINTWNVDKDFIDIGTPKSLEKANYFCKFN